MDHICTFNCDMTFVSYPRLHRSANIIFMVWELHQASQRPRQDKSAALPTPVAFPGKQPLLCERCQQLTAQFLTRCGEAVQDAGLRPDDQIWLTVFGALKQMLEARECCVSCQELRTSATEQASAKPSPIASRLNPWRTNIGSSGTGR